MKSKMNNINPFIIEGYAGKEYFCDREEETSMLIEHLENQRNVTLYSPRRMGKSGLIQHVFAHYAGKKNVHCYYVDIMHTWCLKSFIDKLASVLMGSLDSKMEVFMQNAIKVLGHLRPTFSYDPITSSPTLSLDIAKSQEEATLKSIFEYIKQKGETCYIAIDEFQQISEYPETGVEALLRSYIQFVPHATFIFSGSRRHMIVNMFTNPKKAFFASTSMMLLPEIDKEKYCEFAMDKFRQSGRELSPELFDKIYTTVYGHTWYIQDWLNYIYGKAKSDVTDDDLQIALSQILRENTDSFYMLIQSLTSAERQVLTAIAKEGIVTEPQGTDFLRKYSLSAASTVRSCLSRLVDREIVYEYNGEYSVYNRFLGLWLRAS